jgi:hypothetical protein
MKNCSKKIPQLILFCLGVLFFSPTNAQKKDFNIQIQEEDSSAGFDEKVAIYKQHKLGIPDLYQFPFIDRERQEYIFQKYYGTPGGRSSRISGSQPLMNSGSGIDCGSIVTSPSCATSSNNMDFELGTFQYWTGFYGDAFFWKSGNPSGVGSYYSYMNVGSTPFIKGISTPRHRIVHTVADKDPFGGFPIVNQGGIFSLKLGNSYWNAESEIIQRKFVYDPAHPIVVFKYAIVMEDPGHAAEDQPYFEATIFDKNCNAISCATIVAVANKNLPNFTAFPSGFYDGRYTVGGFYKPWSTAFFNLANLGTTFTIGDEYTVSFKTADCALGGHFGYAYVELGCNADDIIAMSGRKCINKPLKFIAPAGNSASEAYTWGLEKYNSNTNSWDIDNSVTLTGGSAFFRTCTFKEPGRYRITLNYRLKASPCSTSDFSKEFIIENCADEIVACEECIKSFSPLVNEPYRFEVWVREEQIPISYDAYTNPGIQFLFNGIGSSTAVFKPQGPIIDGWQRITGTFTIPTGTQKLEIKLSNANTGNRDVYFDDLRIYPSRGTVKSFVYNPQTMQLMAQLDENNFATFYEYNQEGKAIRVKVETEKGVYSVKEQGSFLKR